MGGYETTTAVMIWRPLSSHVYHKIAACWLAGWLTTNAPGDRRAMATRAMITTKVTTWAMVMATRLAGNKEGKGNGGKGDGNGNEVGG